MARFRRVSRRWRNGAGCCCRSARGTRRGRRSARRRPCNGCSTARAACCPSTKSWRNTISRGSGRGSMSRRAPWQIGSRVTACWHASNRSRANATRRSLKRRSRISARRVSPRARERPTATRGRSSWSACHDPGTTLVEQILAAHGQVHGAGERSALQLAAERLGGSAASPGLAGRLAALDAASA